jgi:hypothetical protein
MTIAVYELTTGNLIATPASSADVVNPLPANIGAKDVGIIPGGYVWNSVACEFQAPMNPRNITKDDLIRRFSEVELNKFLLAAKNTDLVEGQKDLLYAFQKHLSMRATVNLDEPAIKNGIKYLEFCGLLEEGRAAQLLG